MTDPSYELADTVEDRLARLQAASTRKAEAAKEYERLRDEVLDELEVEQDEQGRRYFVDESGRKRYATRVEPDVTVVDLVWAKENLPPEVYEQMVQEKADLAAIERLRLNKTLTAQQLKRLIRYTNGTARVYVSPPMG